MPSCAFSRSSALVSSPDFGAHIIPTIAPTPKPMANAEITSGQLFRIIKLSFKSVDLRSEVRPNSCEPGDNAPAFYAAPTLHNRAAYLLAAPRTIR
jgi:hypothetical protein